jgi:hypothetical protein
MNYLLIIGIFSILAGAVATDMTRDSKNFKADWFGNLLGFFATIAFIFLGLLFITAGILKYIEQDIRGKSIQEVQQQYRTIKGG